MQMVSMMSRMTEQMARMTSSNEFIASQNETPDKYQDCFKLVPASVKTIMETWQRSSKHLLDQHIVQQKLKDKYQMHIDKNTIPPEINSKEKS